MDIEKICSDAKLTGWSPETTIKHLHDLAEHFPQLSFSHNSRTDINAEVVGALRHGIYAIANLMRENAALQIENERLRDELEQVKREKDAAASDLESVMAYRGDNGDNLDTCQFCKNGQCYVRGGTKQCLPQWRGPKEGKENA